MNVVLAFVIVTGLYMHGFEAESETSSAAISGIMPNSPAAAAGLQPGDKIVEIAGHKNPNWPDVLMQTALNGNHAIPVVVDRKGRKVGVRLTPRMDPKEGVGVAGWRGGIQVGEVMKGLPGYKAGLRPGDSFVSVNGKPVSTPEAVRDAVIGSHGTPVQMTIMRAGETQKLQVTPVADKDPKMPWHIGISFKLPVQWVKLSFGPALAQSARFNRQNALLIFQLVGSLIERRVSPRTTLAGPIQIAQMSSEAAQEGAFSYLTLMALLSLNLAIFNLLPIPILDGGALLLLIVEMLLQREVTLQVKEMVFKLGFVFLMMIVVFVIYNDISRILTKS
jgi:regulator of sigma E protease